MIPKRHRLLLGLAAALAALIVLGGLLQAIRTLNALIEEENDPRPTAQAAE